MFATQPTATTAIGCLEELLRSALLVDQTDAGGARLEALDRSGIDEDLDSGRLEAAR